MTSLEFQIITPQKLLLKGEAEMIVVPGTKGELGILPHHAPLLSTLKKGVVRIKQKEEEQSFPIEGGLIEISSNKVVVLADMM